MKRYSTFLKALTQSNMSVKLTQKFVLNVKHWSTCGSKMTKRGICTATERGRANEDVFKL